MKKYKDYTRYTLRQRAKYKLVGLYFWLKKIIRYLVRRGRYHKQGLTWKIEKKQRIARFRKDAKQSRLENKLKKQETKQ